MGKEKTKNIRADEILEMVLNEQTCVSAGRGEFRSFMTQYPELRELWYSQEFKPEMFGNLRKLVVHKSEFLSDVLLPLNLLRGLSNLEELEVSECDSLKAVFDLSNVSGKEVSVKETIQLKRMTLLRLPMLKDIWKQNFQKIVSSRETTIEEGGGEEGAIQHQQPAYSIRQPKQMWSRDPQTSLRLHNLQVVHVEDCNALEYIFPFSIAMDLPQLEEITIKDAWKIKEIVSAKARPLDCPPKFEFNRMSSLVLWNLTELRGFFAGNHSLACPSLKELDVRGCFKWELFMKQGASSKGRVFDRSLQVSMQKSSFPLEEVICNLETLGLNYEDARVILQGQFSGENFSKLKSLYLAHFTDGQATFPYWFVQNITTLQTLLVEHSSFKEMFQHGRQNGIQTRIKELTLNQLHELQHICKEGFPMDPVLEILEVLYVGGCSKLKHLLPSSATFNHLTDLEVEDCSGLIDLFTSSTARSLVKLTTMKIRNCYSLEQVVAEERDEPKDLWRVCISKCPRMEIFSLGKTHMPKLGNVITQKENHLQGDLNTALIKIFQDNAIGERDKGDYEESSRKVSEINGASSLEDTTKQEIHKLPSPSDDKEQKENILSTDPQHAAKESQRMHDTNDRVSIQDWDHMQWFVCSVWELINYFYTNASLIHKNNPMAIVDTLPRHCALATAYVNETIEKPFIQTAQEAQRSDAVQDEDIGTQDIHDTTEKTLIQSDKDTEKLTIAQTIESHDSYVEPKEMCNTIKKPLIPAAQNEPNPTIILNAAIETQELHDTMEKPLIHSDQDAKKHATAQAIAIETQEIHDTSEKPLIQYDQNVEKVATVQTTGNDFVLQAPVKFCKRISSLIMLFSLLSSY
ncbi:uncharacterized protein LOC129295531 [Prosopis cineraria]|uniref:uncharacterized protein LOC129295531 n=1 Tax=Prosopis cineraria TaxID=364024 RepID=UPI0024108855|nr:uncharacterized protein LOC129295531 [Prosopis cineraria]